MKWRHEYLLAVWLLPLYTCVRFDGSLSCTGECAMSRDIGQLFSWLLAIVLTGAFMSLKGDTKGKRK